MAGGGVINHLIAARGGSMDDPFRGRTVDQRSAMAGTRPSPITIDDESINYYLPVVPFNLFCRGRGRYRFTLHRESDETPLERFHSPQINHRFGIPLLPRRTLRTFRRWWTMWAQVLKMKGILIKGRINIFIDINCWKVRWNWWVSIKLLRWEWPNCVILDVKLSRWSMNVMRLVFREIVWWAALLRQLTKDIT